jgi:hypothetical protein
MRKGYLLLLFVAGALVILTHETPDTVYHIPKESTCVGALVFSDGEPVLVGAEYENGEQVKRVAGLYVLKVGEDVLTIDIYSWGTRTLFKKEVHTISELKQEYPQGVSIWVEQGATSAFVVFVPWQ